MIIKILTLVLSLILVIGLIFLTYWLSQKASIPYMNGNQSKYMEIIDRIMIGRDKSLVIIKVQEEYYLLSVCEQKIELMERLDSDFDQAQHNIQPQQFNQLLQGVFKQKKTKGQEDKERERQNP